MSAQLSFFDGSGTVPVPNRTDDYTDLRENGSARLEPVPELVAKNSMITAVPAVLSKERENYRTGTSRPDPIGEGESIATLSPISGHGGRAEVLTRGPGNEESEAGTAEPIPGTAPTLRPYQASAIAAAETELESQRSTLIVLPTGCHRAGQLVLMHDGTTRAVEEVIVGDRLLGVDGGRLVESLVRGTGDMFEIRPTKGAPWVVDGDHILTLVKTSQGGDYPSTKGGGLIDVTVRDWLSWSRTAKHIHKLLRVGVEFPARPEPRIQPYVLGVLLGDGSLKRGITVTAADREIWRACEPESARWGLRFVEQTPANRCHGFRFAASSQGPGTNALLAELGRLGLRVNSGEKFIPDDYRLGSRTGRLNLLAGLIDTDGHLRRDGGHEFLSKSARLASDVAFIARSLGLAAYVTDKISTYRGERRRYYRVSISGALDAIPCRVPRKRAASRRQKKDVLRTGFTVHATGTREPFFGFVLDGDRRYLLDDFTVTHNCGKTVVFSELIRRTVSAGGRALVLAHRTELLDQAAKKLLDVGVWAQLERGPMRAGLAPVVIASVQTLHAKRLVRFAPSAFRLVVVDEAHHATAGSYRAILEHFAGARVLGVTATADRADGSGLGEVFASLAYRYDLRQAINDGHLARIRARRIVVEGLDLSSVKTRAGDLAQNELAEIMQREEVLHGIASPLLEQAGDRRTIVFCVDVANAHALAEILNRHRDGCARALDGSTDELARRTALHEFRLGKFQYLVNCALFTEGFDEPTIACVAVCRPTKSRALYTQMAGRGTRLAPGKTDCLLLDFTGNSGRHRLIGPADCLAGVELDAERAAAADRLLDAEQLELEDVLTAADDEVAKHRARVTLVANARYHTTEVDPFLGAFLDRNRKPEKWDGQPASEAQLDALTKAGLGKAPAGLTKGEASAMLDAVSKRRMAGLATIPQVRLLEKLGLEAKQMKFERANELIARCRATGSWKPYVFMHEPEFRRRKA